MSRRYLIGDNEYITTLEDWAYSASSGIEVPGKDYDHSLLIDIPLDIESKLPNNSFEALLHTVSKL